MQIQTDLKRTPGSAPGPTLGNEYGKPLPFYTTAGHVYHGAHAKDCQTAVGPSVRDSNRALPLLSIARLIKDGLSAFKTMLTLF